MMIKPAVYESLTPRQRVVAAMEAVGRNDTAEADRLRQTCQFKTYRQRDAEFSDRMDAIHRAALAVHIDLQSAVLLWVAGHCENDAYLQRAANIHAAWLGALGSVGITSPNAVAGASLEANTVLAFALDAMPAPDAEAVAELQDEMRQLFAP